LNEVFFRRFVLYRLTAGAEEHSSTKAKKAHEFAGRSHHFEFNVWNALCGAENFSLRAVVLSCLM
jgi:hypothetical protein